MKILLSFGHGSETVRLGSMAKACLLAFTLQIFFFSPISPDLLELPPLSSSASHLLPTNTHLQRVIKLGEGYLKDPEDVCVDRNGVVYTATRDGWVKRLHKNGTWQDWKFIDGHALFGITTTMENDLIVCDAEKGLLEVSENGVLTVFAAHVNGSKISGNPYLWLFATMGVLRPDATGCTG